MYINPSKIRISIDNSVKHISNVAAMALSGAIENGLLLTGTDENHIIIYNNRIEFGPCRNDELTGIGGHIFGNFYKEYGNIIYRFGSNIKCSFFTKTIEYNGIMPPSTPDNETLYHLIYPKFS